MGEMSDFTLDQIMNEDDLYIRYLLGDLELREAYNQGIINEMDGLSGTESPPKTCGICGEKNLSWKQVSGKWKLFKGNKIHKCEKHLDDWAEEI